MNKLSITAIVLTYNEKLHLERCLQSLVGICERIIVVDSFSNDETELIANKYKADFYQNKFINHATQLNWGINNSSIETSWTIRVDADEFLTDKLKENLRNLFLKGISNNVSGIRIKRLMYFLDKPLKKGGMYPIKHLKIWRTNTAICEQRWMDERIKLTNDGEIIDVEGDLVDYNLNKITWWTVKHNSYATREAIDILDKIYGFTNSSQEVMKGNFFGSSEERRRWLKNRYLKMPLFVRPFLFWFIRYFLQLGFLEGKRGFIWNFLQCFWYRFLVDTKIFEAYKSAGKDKNKLIRFFKEEYGYDVTKI